MSRLIYLQKTFDTSSKPNGHFITNEELKELSQLLLDLAEYMDYRKDSTMRVAFLTECQNVERMIMAREYIAKVKSSN